MPRPDSSKTVQGNIEFFGGAVTLKDVERLSLGEVRRVAFAGRSNVGKSSLLNALTGTKMARVSAEPGKTREMNFYGWHVRRAPSGIAKSDPLSKTAWILVDLPGYGYAKVQTKLREQWGKHITSWMQGDGALQLVVALVDGRHGFLANDVELIEFLKSTGVPFVVAFTKMDKHKSNNQKRQAERELAAVAAKAGVERFIFVSSTEKGGIRSLEELLREPA